MPPLPPPLDVHNRPAQELAGYSTSVVDDGGETKRPTGPGVADDETVLSGTADQSTYVDAVPAAFTPLASAGEVLVDLTTATHVYLSARVLTALSGAELRRQYLRESDSTWRYLDGVGGPAVPMTATGRIKGQPVAVESFATLQGKCWCRLGTFGGDAASPLRVGHVRMHRGPAPEIIGDIWDYNPTEGAGVTIVEKTGSGIDMVTNGAWVGDALRYEITGINNFTRGMASSDLFALAPHSTVVLYVKIPAGFTVGSQGWLFGRKPGPLSGALLDHEFSVNASGNFTTTIRTTTAAIPSNTDVTVTSTTVAVADTAYVVGMTHDGVTLKLWVNGVVEDSAAAGNSELPPTPGTYIIVGGGAAPFASEVPIDDEEIGRCIIGNRALDAGEMAQLYAEFKVQYPGLP